MEILYVLTHRLVKDIYEKGPPVQYNSVGIQGKCGTAIKLLWDFKALLY